MFCLHTFKKIINCGKKMKYVLSQVQLQTFPYSLDVHFELNPCALSLSTSLEESKWKNVIA